MRYPLIVLILALTALAGGFAFVEWSKGGSGAGLYSRHWSPEAVQGYWDPATFYQSPDSVQGVFKGEECVQCHEAVTPGIVADWRNSRHAKAGERVWCSGCHGDDHQRLHLPTPAVCGGCHGKQHGEFKAEADFGFPSHVLAMDRALSAPHFVDKPKAEVQSCVQCHSVATKCDSCHTRHRFDAAEARRPEACITCHSGPPHPDDETYFASAHGRLYRAEGDQWDWSKPLVKGNYKVPTCAYCHMEGGRHQVANKSLWKFGLLEVNPHTAANKALRRDWVGLCGDCHEAEKARQWLSDLDRERKQAWKMLNEAEAILKGLRTEDLLFPAPEERPAYPLEQRPRAHIGFYEGQASAFYNVSAVERDYFEMWYFDSLGAYKAAAHGDWARISKGHKGMAASLEKIRQQAGSLRDLKIVEQKAGIEASTEGLWQRGAYTDYNRDQN
ncbi:MAG: hydroxylamine oxidoreductase [Gammaproteobacteria bacterium]|nr:hydroxylamine oxidoreductase [Gammaproteobacteria bacterium]MBU1654947.1 hydroxylamine oxidoreductase [Gammaproteobacteria bacterium]MBU1960499.1 hydroxylamine oxidoreductase [Gammaproteobacteria bacterium]